MATEFALLVMASTTVLQGRADVSIAMGTATDLTAASADIVLLKPSLANVNRALQICCLIRRKVLMNFICSAAYNIVAIPLAVGVFNSCTFPQHILEHSWHYHR